MTELVFILDRSGSMNKLTEDTIGGFNAMIEKQGQEQQDALVTTVLFDSVVERIHDRIPLEEVPELTDAVYFTRGCTALLDAVGSTIRHIARIHKYAREEDRPQKTLFIITTDGLENASRRYDYETVRRMINHEQEKYGWEFIFLGADIDVAKEAKRMGIRSDRAVSYRKSKKGLGDLYTMAGEVVTAVRNDECFDRILQDFEEEERQKTNKRKHPG